MQRLLLFRKLFVNRPFVSSAFLGTFTFPFPFFKSNIYSAFGKSHFSLLWSLKYHPTKKTIYDSVFLGECEDVTSIIKVEPHANEDLKIIVEDYTPISKHKDLFRKCSLAEEIARFTKNKKVKFIKSEECPEDFWAEVIKTPTTPTILFNEAFNQAQVEVKFIKSEECPEDFWAEVKKIASISAKTAQTPTTLLLNEAFNQAATQVKIDWQNQSIIFFYNKKNSKIVIQSFNKWCYYPCNSSDDLKRVVNLFTSQKIFKNLQVFNYRTLSHLIFSLFRKRYDPKNLWVYKKDYDGFFNLADYQFDPTLNFSYTRLESILDLDYPSGEPIRSTVGDIEKFGFSQVKIKVTPENKEYTLPIHDKESSVYFNSELKYAINQGYEFEVTETFIFNSQKYQEIGKLYRDLEDNSLCNEELKLMIWKYIIISLPANLYEREDYNQYQFSDTTFGLAFASYARMHSVIF